MTRADHVDAIRRRLAAATPGPWRVDLNRHGDIHAIGRVHSNAEYTGYWHESRIVASDGDAELIANARGDIDWLLTELTAAAAREEMLFADLETTRANFGLVHDQLVDTQECLRALQAANAARCERDTEAINTDYARRLNQGSPSV